MSDTPQAPLRERPEVRLFDDSGMPWRPVSAKLVPARLTLLAAGLVVPLGVAVVLAFQVADGWWWAVVAVALVGVGGTWVVLRQVSAISWVELEEELVVRRGRIFRSLVSVPYGRLQYVDVHSGPLDRLLGIAEVTLHTASPQLSAGIPGLPVAEAEALRQRLAARGESQRAGL
ncbi:MAG TPA: PH domain-containing protein [Pedococcus sp.]|nr:PH domain-containing protein [Pedococcus sp.]